jgi:hypothetical protein
MSHGGREVGAGDHLVVEGPDGQADVPVRESNFDAGSAPQWFEFIETDGDPGTHGEGDPFDLFSRPGDLAVRIAKKEFDLGAALGLGAQRFSEIRDRQPPPT